MCPRNEANLCSILCGGDMSVHVSYHFYVCMQAPLLDANFLDQLCLSDELWAKVEVPDVKGGLYMYNYLSHQTFIYSVT